MESLLLLLTALGVPAPGAVFCYCTTFQFTPPSGTSTIFELKNEGRLLLYLK